MRLLKPLILSLIICILTCGSSVSAQGGAFSYQKIKKAENAIPVMSVVGIKERHVISKEETLLDIAREHGLGFNEIKLAHPGMDPWVPPEGRTIDIPLIWVLPETGYEDIVINIPEMRLYRFFPDLGLVKTYPIGIGRQGMDTPITDTKVAAKIKNPDWTVPEDTRQRIEKAIIPPGPDNPLGKRWIGLDLDQIGIHGTNFPWGIGRRVSQGCIRMYPEHIKTFFNEVSVNDRVEIIYEPVKVGTVNGTIFVEIHPDIHGIFPDMYKRAQQLLKERAMLPGVDQKKLRIAAAEQNGVPEPVGIIPKPLTQY